jgi:hypothetical protein
MDGEWEEIHRTVTTVVERDDEGYPLTLPNSGIRFYTGRKSPYGYGDYFGWYNALGARPAVKREKEDGTDG